MCGRYTLATDIEGFLAELGLSAPPELAHPRRYNIAPSQPVMGLVADPSPRIEVMEWGFLPGWATPEKKMKPVINARADSVLAKKPYFRGAFRSGRCAIIADGFYEWKKQGELKHPYRIMMADERPFAMAGLWSWIHAGDGSERATCAIITVEPNELMQEIHNRMPAILSTEEVAVWLDPTSREADLHALLDPYPPEAMHAYEVSRRVNSPANDVPECIEPIDDDE